MQQSRAQWPDASCSRPQGQPLWCYRSARKARGRPAGALTPPAPAAPPCHACGPAPHIHGPPCSQQLTAGVRRPSCAGMQWPTAAVAADSGATACMCAVPRHGCCAALWGGLDSCPRPPHMRSTADLKHALGRHALRRTAAAPAPDALQRQHPVNDCPDLALLHQSPHSGKLPAVGAHHDQAESRPQAQCMQQQPAAERDTHGRQS